MKGELLLFLRNVRSYGIQGLPNFIRNRYKKLNHWVRLTANAIQHPCHEHARGVTVIAGFRRQQSLSKTMRDLLLSLKKADIPYQTFDLDDTSEIPESSYKGLLTPVKNFRIFKHDCVIQMLTDNVPPFVKIKRSFIVFWEYDSGIAPAYPWLLRADAIIGMSDFNANYYRNEFSRDIAVSKILYPLQIRDKHLSETAEVRSRLGIGKDDFVVFYNFGLAMARKNPEGCIKAFAEAFAGDAQIKLLLKTAYSEGFSSYLPVLQQMIDAAGIANQTIILSKYVSDQEIFDITNACDVYMSLHRGEGFGIGIAEAMSLGKPVIVTDYSAPTEYCKTGHALTVPYRLEKCKFTPEEQNTYFAVQRWAEPDIQAAARMLKLCKDNEAFRTQIGLAGKHFVLTHFSNANFKQSMDNFLDKFCQQSAFGQRE